MLIYDKKFIGKSIPIMLLRFSLATIAAEVLEIVYSLADCVYIGARSQIGLSGYSASESLEYIAPIFGTMFMSGLNTQVSRLLSQGQTKLIKYIFLISFVVNLVATIIISIIIYCCLDKLQQLLFIVDEVKEASTNYLTPIIWGGVITATFHLFQGFSMGMGDVKIYSWLTIGSMVLGLCLSPIFVIACGMNEFGAGLARITCNLIPVIIFLLYYAFFDQTIKPFKRSNNGLKGKFSYKLMWKEFGDVCWLGVSNMLMILLWTIYLGISFYLISSIAQNLNMYDQISALFGVSSRFQTLILAFSTGLNFGALSLASYSEGQKDTVRVMKVLKINFIVCAIVASVLSTITEAATVPFLKIFSLEGTQEQIDMFRIVVSVGYLQYFCLCTETSLQALAKAVLANVWIGVTCFLLIFIQYIIYWSIHKQTVADMYLQIGSLVIEYGLVVLWSISILVYVFHKNKEILKPNTQTSSYV